MPIFARLLSSMESILIYKITQGMYCYYKAQISKLFKHKSVCVTFDYCISSPETHVHW